MLPGLDELPDDIKLHVYFDEKGHDAMLTHSSSADGIKLNAFFDKEWKAAILTQIAGCNCINLN